MTPSPNLPQELDTLFNDLSQPDLEEPLEVVEGSIWALWCSHPDDDAVQRMERVIGGLSQGRFHRGGRTHPRRADSRLSRLGGGLEQARHTILLQD